MHEYFAILKVKGIGNQGGYEVVIHDADEEGLDQKIKLYTGVKLVQKFIAAQTELVINEENC